MIRKLTFDEIFDRQPSLEELQALKTSPIFTLVENIRSMYNVGSIFRTSDGARIRKLFLTGFTARPPRKEIDKTALGATDSVPWDYADHSGAVIQKLKTAGVSIVVLEHTDASVPYYELEYQYPVCLVLGNEVDGVSEPAIRLADHCIEIPMFGIKQSLNVSVAYGVVLYHILSSYLQRL